MDRATSRRDGRLPVPGTVLTRPFENRRIVVTVLEQGFEYQSRRYRSLSAIALYWPVERILVAAAQFWTTVK